MSKPLSISLGKAKGVPRPNNNKPSSANNFITTAASRRVNTTPITADPDEDAADEAAPVHESVLGFGQDGDAILKAAAPTKAERVIENRGNADWRTRGRAQQRDVEESEQQEDGGGGGEEMLDASGRSMVAREKASRQAGLQYAEKFTSRVDSTTRRTQGSGVEGAEKQESQTMDQAALSALVNGNEGFSSRTIEQSSSQGLNDTTGDETLDLRADVASRPDSASLDDYAAMPVEEFGMALLRGMGQKRRAVGEVIVIKNPNAPDDDVGNGKEVKLGRDRKKPAITIKRDPNMGYLGIGARAIKIGNGGGGTSSAAAEAGLGAWGKADMRKSRKGGEGAAVMYTPVMLQNRRTGELISERELEEKKKQQRETMKVEKQPEIKETSRKSHERSTGKAKSINDATGRDRGTRRINNHDSYNSPSRDNGSNPPSRSRRHPHRRHPSRSPSLSSSSSSSTPPASSRRRRRRSRSRSRSNRSSGRYRDRTRGQYRDHATHETRDDRDRSRRRRRGMDDQDLWRYGQNKERDSYRDRDGDRDGDRDRNRNRDRRRE